MIRPSSYRAPQEKNRLNFGIQTIKQLVVVWEKWCGGGHEFTCGLSWLWNRERRYIEPHPEIDIQRIRGTVERPSMKIASGDHVGSACVRLLRTPQFSLLNKKLSSLPTINSPFHSSLLTLISLFSLINAIYKKKRLASFNGIHINVAYDNYQPYHSSHPLDNKFIS